MFNVHIIVADPKVQIMKDSIEACDCRILQVEFGEGDKIQLEFSSLADLKAFVGLLNISIQPDEEVSH